MQSSGSPAMNAELPTQRLVSRNEISRRYVIKSGSIRKFKQISKATLPPRRLLYVYSNPSLETVISFRSLAAKVQHTTYMPQFSAIHSRGAILVLLAPSSPIYATYHSTPKNLAQVLATCVTLVLV
jgi:hypothetical protein